MKVFAIRDESEENQTDLAYLIYYEKEKRFYIELPDQADPWDTPLLLSSFAKQGQWSVDSHWSKLWVQQRIVPTDRQNLGQILKDNGLEEYDEYQLLLLANGRCAQDSYYLAEINRNLLKAYFPDRYSRKIEQIIPSADRQLLVFFADGTIKRCDIEKLVSSKPVFKRVLQDSAIFSKVSIQPGGYGLQWGEQLMLDDKTLYDHGVCLPLMKEDFQNYIVWNLVSTSEAAKLMDCSRQNINDLVNREKLVPVKVEQKNRFFLKSDILKRRWK